VSYTLLYHPQVAEADLPQIPANLRHRIARWKLASVRPLRSTGEPLKGTLKGYWKLRVGDYRAVYRIVEAEVWIFGLLHRGKIYGEVLPRAGWRPV